MSDNEKVKTVCFMKQIALEQCESIKEFINKLLDYIEQWHKNIKVE